MNFKLTHYPAMRYQTVLRGGVFGGKLHEQGRPEETPDKRREIAEQLAEAMARDGISRELFADMLGFLGIPSGPTGPPDARLAHLLKAVEDAYRSVLVSRDDGTND